MVRQLEEGVGHEMLASTQGPEVPTCLLAAPTASLRPLPLQTLGLMTTSATACWEVPLQPPSIWWAPPRRCSSAGKCREGLQLVCRRHVLAAVQAASEVVLVAAPSWSLPVREAGASSLQAVGPCEPQAPAVCGSRAG